MVGTVSAHTFDFILLSQHPSGRETAGFLYEAGLEFEVRPVSSRRAGATDCAVLLYYKSIHRVYEYIRSL